MASKYAKPLQVPADFPDVLRNFAREVLRLQGKVETRDQIYEFGVQYFQELLVKRDGVNAKLAAVTDSSAPKYMALSEEAIMTILQKAFHDLDSENHGVVAFDSLKQVHENNLVL